MKFLIVNCFREDWPTARLLLSDSQFLKKINDYDRDSVTDATIVKLKKYIDNPKFMPEAVEKVSKVIGYFLYFCRLFI